MNIKLKHTLLLLLLAIIAGACSTSKKAVTPQNGGNIESASTYFNGIIRQSDAWQQTKVPFNVSISQPTQLSASGQAIMVRGKSIDLSVRVLGMEVAALYLTNDSILVIDRWNKRYISENLRQFLKGFPADISNLQDLLTGRPFILGKESINANSFSNFNVEQQGRSWGIEPKQSIGGLNYAFVFSAQQILSTLVSAGSTEVNINYGEPDNTTAGTFASSIAINAEAGKKPISASIQWRWDKAQFGNSFSPRRIEKPNNYTRINAADLLAKLKVK